MNKLFKSIIVLSVICAVVSSLLALTNHKTKPIIERNKKIAEDKALAEVLPEGKNFKDVPISDNLPKTIVSISRDKNAGYVFKISVTGYKPDMVILCGIDNNGVIQGAKCLESNETLGKEKTYGEKFKGKTVDTYNEIDTIATATYTTKGYKEAIKAALDAFTILNGGTADLRSEEEILKDNLNTALPAAVGEFKSVIMIEEIEGVSDVYEAVNGSGYVLAMDKVFVAIDKEGNLLTELTDETKPAAETAAKIVIGWFESEIDLSKYENMPTQVRKAYKTKDGNYTLILYAAGYSVNYASEYENSGEYIVIKVVATNKGEIVSCVTLSQAESDNYGAVCGDKSYYSQFDGKTEANYTDVDAISKATITTNAYMNAISKVFESIKIMEGVS